MVAALPGIRCRQIETSDIAAVAALLRRGFPNREQGFWDHALGELQRREPPAGLPQYGYLLETGGKLVGAILMICSAIPAGETFAPRCNLSSWFVEPAFRAYASLLVTQALRHKDVTYLNVSAAPHTWPIIEAQGFARYSNGLFVCLPALARNGGEAVEIVDGPLPPAIAADAFERQVVAQHTEHGCIGLWCVAGGRAYPFVFRQRLVKGFIPCAQLIYCRDIGDFARFAGPLGRYLARRGRPIVIADANAAIPGMPGLFRRGSKPKYFKGPQRPRLGDLAYTEYAIMGV